MRISIRRLRPVACSVIVRPNGDLGLVLGDRKSTRLNSSHLVISYAVFCLKKKNNVAAPHPSAHSTDCGIDPPTSLLGPLLVRRLGHPRLLATVLREHSEVPSATLLCIAPG